MKSSVKYAIVPFPFLKGQDLLEKSTATCFLFSFIHGFFKVKP
jgi:hypothetical protein